jgi:hypothetical protein
MLLASCPGSLVHALFLSPLFRQFLTPNHGALSFFGCRALALEPEVHVIGKILDDDLRA